jgi:hypothetical protein
MFTARRGAVKPSQPPGPPAQTLPLEPPAPVTASGPAAAGDLGGLHVPDATPPLKPDA